jgi:excisionase family DNA binding protein
VNGTRPRHAGKETEPRPLPAPHGVHRVDALAAALVAVTDLPLAMASLERRVVALSAEIQRMRSRLPTPVVPVRQAAEVLGCSVPTVRRRIRLGEIPAVRVGRAVRVDLSKIRSFDHEEITALTERARSDARMHAQSDGKQ